MRMNLAAICFKVCLVAQLGGSSVKAETLTNQSWKAQWIGPANLPKVDLAGASWIWTDDAGVDATRNAPPGKRFFRREIYLSGNAGVTSAAAVFSADNKFKLFVNGKTVGQGDTWGNPGTLDIRAALQSGVNRVVVQAENNPADGDLNAAGLIGKIHIERKGHPRAEIVTDATWLAAKSEDATEWKAARVLGANGIGPWSVIKVDQSAPLNVWNCYRKSFTLDGRPESAIARIGVDSKYWLWVNGKMVVYEGGLKRGPNPRDTYYDRVDLAPFLKKGSNTIAVLAWYWGKDGFSHKSSGKAGLVFELDAGATKISSDASWTMIRHPAYGATGDPHPNYRMSDDNIHFDARLDLGDWTQAGFDDSTWLAASELGKPPAAPWNQLVERPVPLWRTEQLTRYENDGEFPRVSDGKPVIAHLPRNLSISPYLKVKAPAGLTIDMRTDNYKGGSEYNYRSEYVTREGVQEFESLAYLNGHWMIYSIPAGIEIMELRYRETRYDTDFTGSFNSDDTFLNSLWMKARNTMNLNMRDAIQDPDRERAQWWGDEVIVLGQIFHACDIRAHALIRKGIYNLVDFQKPDGVLYSPVPSGNWGNELPMQMLASIGNYGFWQYFLYTGDRATIVHAYPAVKRYLGLYKIGADGLMVHRSGDWDWADWGENIDAPVLENAWLYQALEAAINMARLTGNDADIPGYEAMRTSIANNYNRVLWTGKEYRSPGYEGATDERGHSLAVLFGLAKPEQWPAIKTVLAREFHGSPYIEKYVLEALFKMNHADAAIARMKSRYQKMVESKYTTLWEGWGIGPEGYGGGSYNHGWAGGPLTLMMQYVAGVEPTSPGFATFEVKPQLGGLNKVKAGFDTVKGRIDVDIVRRPESFRLKLTSPGMTVATVCLPLAELGLKTVQLQGRTLWQDGKAVGQLENVTTLGEVAGHVCFSVGPGGWEFDVQ